jgi:hypothetical protein
MVQFNRERMNLTWGLVYRLLGIDYSPPRSPTVQWDLIREAGRTLPISPLELGPFATLTPSVHQVFSEDGYWLLSTGLIEYLIQTGRAPASVVENLLSLDDTEEEHYQEPFSSSLVIFSRGRCLKLLIWLILSGILDKLFLSTLHLQPLST